MSKIRMSASVVRLLTLCAAVSLVTLFPSTSSANYCQVYNNPSPVYFCTDPACANIVGECWSDSSCRVTCTGNTSASYMMYGGYEYCEVCPY